MQRKFIFKDNSRELLLPITPSSFTIEHGIRIETINIHTLGDVNMAGYGTLAILKIDCIFPAKAYPFSFDDGEDPYSYISTFKKWCDDRLVVRFVIPDTPMNISVLIESVGYSEQDGTNDVYATITLREYRQVSAVRVESKKGSENKSRPAATTVVKASTYTVQSGDTLSAICRKFYGNANLYSQVANKNGIKNPNLIRVGQVLSIPDKAQLV